VFSLELSNLLFSHALSLISQFSSKVEVLWDSLLCFHVSLNLSSAHCVLCLFCSICIPTLNGKTHLAELEEDFELCVEILRYEEVVLVCDEELDCSSLFTILVNFASDSFSSLFVKLFWLTSSHSWTELCCINEIIIEFSLESSICVTREELCECIHNILLLLSCIAVHFSVDCSDVSFSTQLNILVFLFCHVLGEGIKIRNLSFLGSVALLNSSHFQF